MADYCTCCIIWSQRHLFSRRSGSGILSSARVLLEMLLDLYLCSRFVLTANIPLCASCSHDSQSHVVSRARSNQTTSHLPCCISTHPSIRPPSNWIVNTNRILGIEQCAVQKRVATPTPAAIQHQAATRPISDQATHSVTYLPRQAPASGPLYLGKQPRDSS